jgi:hypothetical protein
MNENMIHKTNLNITDTIRYLENTIKLLKELRDDLPITSFMHMAKMKQVNDMIEGLK